MSKSFREIVGIPPSTASTSDSVLIIIDAQNEYAVGELKTENVDNTRRAISNLLEKYRAAKAPIVHVVHVTPDGAPVFTPNSHLAKEFSELEPKANEKLVAKSRVSAFEGTDLGEYLKGTGKNKLVLTGYMSHVCVSSTARTASDRGYEVIIAEDGVGDRDIPGATAAQVVATVMAEIGDSFGTILKSTDIK